jgi:hypothetical protein
MNMQREIRRRFYRGCGNKQRHNSEGAAKAHVRSLLKLNPDEKLNVYCCGFCARWHVGHVISAPQK